MVHTNSVVLVICNTGRPRVESGQQLDIATVLTTVLTANAKPAHPAAPISPYRTYAQNAVKHCPGS